MIAIATHQERPINPQAVRALYDAVAWWPDRRLEDIAAVLAVGPAIGAWDRERLVGFARAVTDGRLRAYIEDVVVHPEQRHTGIATALLDRLIAALGPIETVSLFCEPELVPMYERHGFRARRSQIVMHHRNEGAEGTP